MPAERCGDGHRVNRAASNPTIALMTLLWTALLPIQAHATLADTLRAVRSGDGERFVMSMNLARTEASPDSEYCNTSLCLFDLREQTEREESVGPFTPWRVEMTSDDAVVHGVWGTRLFDGTNREGYCRVQFVPWRVTRHGTSTVNPSLPKVPSASSK